MQTLFIRVLFILLSATSVCSADTSFVEQFQISPVINEQLADRITQYNTEDINLSSAQQKTELLEIDNQLNQLNQLNTHSDKAVYWFIRGLHYKNLASFYSESQNTALANSNINLKNTAYKRSIELSKTPNNKLSAAIFSTMKLGLPDDLKILATQNEIALGGNGDNDSYYWYLHWSNINQLEDAGRSEEAKSAYKTMQKELKISGMDMSIYNSLTQKIETQTLKISSPQSQQKKPKPEKNKPEPEEKNHAKKYDTKVIIISTIAIFSILSLVAVIVYEIKIKKKNNRKKH